MIYLGTFQLCFPFAFLERRYSVQKTINLKNRLVRLICFGEPGYTGYVFVFK